MRTTKSTKPASLGVAWFRKPLALGFTLVLAILAFSASPALAETHPFVASFGSFTNPNGIAVEESTGDVYIADIGTDTVSRFAADGNPVEFPALHSNVLTGAATPAGSFSFPSLYGTPAAIAVDNSTNPADPSAGDLYVMDAGHDAIDKFSPEGRYLNQIGGLPSVTFNSSRGFFEGELLGLGVDGSGTVHVDLGYFPGLLDEFDDAAVNHLIASQEWPTSVYGGADLPSEPKAHGFAVSATGDDYPIYEPSCSCTLKYGQQLSRSAAWTAKRATSRWPSTPRPATCTQTISPPWPSGTRAR